ncbi:MAG: Tol-Pal system beta propeller repeat protein TolB [Gammaproteobacteria bacterium]|nr:Tol-Pal system beta propeller repeat protein TolB [Gammaproteobacteria bacterium]
MKTRLIGTSIGLALLLWFNNAMAILTIEITQGVEKGLPIAIVPFAWEGANKPAHDIAQIVEVDLVRSGRFTSLSPKDFLSYPQKDTDVDFKDWRLIKAEALLIGSVRELKPGRYQVEFRLFDVFKKAQLAGYRYVVGSEMLRAAAHQISDIVYEKLTGEPGAFSTRIAYVTKEVSNRTHIYKLQIADSDGYGPVTAVKSKEPLMSPAWSPDGQKLAYVSFERKRSMVYVQNVADGKRQMLAEFEGINSAPAWSPDGRRMALTLSKDGNAEIYIMELATRALRRLTRNSAIDTEPAWSPDGRQLVFTSDRVGQPQIYRMNADGSGVERLTFEGSYNARPSYSADGKTLALVTLQGGRYHIGTLQLDNLALQTLTDTQLDESPSFAPNGRMLLYATEIRGKGVLASVSADGRTRHTYRFEMGEVREPAWSPYNQQLRYKE